MRRIFRVFALTWFAWHCVVNAVSQTMQEEIKPRDVVRKAERRPWRSRFIPMFGWSAIIVMDAPKRDIAQVIDLARRHLN
jgi:hypothetical protein